ncbi:MAG: hypothetical protein AAF641_10115 [Pseudomonadota bacterium]
MSDIAAHAAQDTASLKDDGSHSLILSLLLFMGSFTGLYAFTNLLFMACLFIALGLTLVIVVPYTLWRRIRRKRMLKALHEEQLQQLRAEKAKERFDGSSAI